jgi:hypothetical protein
MLLRSGVCHDVLQVRLFEPVVVLHVAFLSILIVPDLQFSFYNCARVVLAKRPSDNCAGSLKL